ncbi:MAG: biosynthetic-type acetolactate synthase large subunit [Spirochaetes bacterium]|nr:biosynthetic-type acetolactate synthase large subunit [Spirochaetota bacterium]
MKFNGAEIIIKLLERYGVSIITGIPGSANLPMYDALYQSNKINHVLARHEQGAGFIAQGIARSTGKPAVCFATSGPGVTNLLTAIADARIDSVPVIAITGQVPISLVGTDAFQEIDTYGLTIPITKHNFFIRDVSELFYAIPEAFKIAMSQRPGPVVIDIPKNIQQQPYEFNEWPDFNIPNNSPIDKPAIIHIAEMINSSERPLIYTGGGVITSDSSAYIKEISKINSIPVTSTLMGLGSFPGDDPMFTGIPGMHGARYTNNIMMQSDLIIALGVRFNDRATGKVDEFCPDAKIIHIDIDPVEIDKIKQSTVSINGDIKEILKLLIPDLSENTRENWISFIMKQKEQHSCFIHNDPWHPSNLIKYISRIVSADTIITTDVGQHQMWTAQSYPFRQPRTFLTSGGLGTMGFGLPAAIGASIANPGKTVICISGDGSFMMNIQELATLADLKIPVKVIIMNNHHLGLVRQQQEMFYNSHIFASKFITNPDFAKIADNFSISGYSIKQNDDLAVLKDALLSSGPCVIDLQINHEYNVLPIVPSGEANYNMIGG